MTEDEKKQAGGATMPSWLAKSLPAILAFALGTSGATGVGYLGQEKAGEIIASELTLQIEKRFAEQDKKLTRILGATEFNAARWTELAARVQRLEDKLDAHEKIGGHAVMDNRVNRLEGFHRGR